MIGGYRYRGSSIPGLGGFYLFADYCNGTVWASLRLATGEWGFAPLAFSDLSISTFGEDEAGELYVGDSQGSLYRLQAGSPLVSIGSSRVTEGNAGTQDAVFPVFLLPSASVGVSVSYGSVDDSAKAGSDYTGSSGTLAFAPGETTSTVTIPVLGDMEVESDEAFYIDLGAPVNATVAWPYGRGEILNDDIGLWISPDWYVTEGDTWNGVANLEVKLTRPSASVVTVDFATVDGTAVAGSDYLPTSGTLTFTPGVTSVRMSVQVLSDTLVEPAEHFTVILSNPVGASLVVGSVAQPIQDNDRGPDISVGNVTTVEGDSGVTSAAFIVSLARPSVQVVSVTYATLSFTARGLLDGGSDFVNASGVIAFAPGETTHTIEVAILGDTLHEANEFFVFRLSSAVNGTVVQDSGQGWINNDDAPPLVSVTGASANEGQPGGVRDLGIAVGLSAPSALTVEIPYATRPGTALESWVIRPQRSEEVWLTGPGKASVYPSKIVVPSFAGMVRRVMVTLKLSGVTTSVVDVLLVGPRGQSVLLMSDAGNGPVHAELTFDADALPLPLGTNLSSGTYRPTDYDLPGNTDSFGQPAPTGPHGTGLSVFRGVNPVGTWSLFAMSALPEGFPPGVIYEWGLEIASEGDFVHTAGTMKIEPGGTSAEIKVPLVGDGAVEPDEAFGLHLEPPTNASLGNGDAVGTILNDDQPAMTLGDSTLLEGSGPSEAGFSLTLDQPGLQPIVVDYATADGTATLADQDYQAATGTLTLPPGATQATIRVPVIGDPWHETDETFVLVLGAPSGASLARGLATGTLRNDDSLPLLSVLDAAAPEGGTVTFAVRLSAPNRDPVSVNYATSSENASPGADYVETSGALHFAPGTLVQTVEVPLLADVLVEPTERFFLDLTGPVNALLGSGRARGFVLDPATASRIQFTSPRFSARESARNALITLRRTGEAKQPVSLTYRASDGSAQPGLDYTPVSGTLTLAPGVTVKSFPVPLLNDALVDGPKTVLLDLSGIEGPALLGAPDTAVLTIADDDLAGKIRFGKPLFSVNEAGGQATIIVQRTGGAAGGVTVEYSMSDDGATAGIDYQPAEGTLLFGPKAMSQAFTVPVLVDAQAEGQERVTLSLADPTGGATLGTPAVATLAIGDAQPTVEFAAPTFAAKEGAARATVTVLRSGPLTGTATVSYATSDGTALQGVDYVPAAGVLTFGPGAASRTFGVDLLNNSLDQAVPTILLSLSGPAGAVLGGQATAVLQVQDNDAAGVVQFGAAGYQASDTSSAAVVAVSRSGGLAQDVQVDYATTDGTAQAGVDYTSASGTLTFGAGVTRQTFSVPLLDDGLAKGDETVLLSLANPTGGSSLGARSTALLTITTSDPTVQFSVAAYRAAPGAASATIVVTRSGPVTTGATVDYATSDGSAVGGEDYATTTGTLTFDPGVKVRTFTVPILANVALEGDETVNLTLASPGGGVAVGKRSTAVLTIPTDDAVVQWALVQVKAGERARSVALVAKRLGSLTTEVTVQYATSDGSAESGTDYVSSGGTISFRPGVASQTVRIPIVDDAPDEGDETFQVTLGDPGPGALLGAPSVATVTILDNDLAGTIELATSDWSVRADGGLATITVTRSGGAAGDVTVDYATGGGTAGPGVDYEAASGTLVFGPGDKAKTFSIAILAAPSTVGNTSVGLTLSNPGGGAALGAKVAGQLWIVKP